MVPYVAVVYHGLSGLSIIFIHCTVQYSTVVQCSAICAYEIPCLSYSRSRKGEDQRQAWLEIIVINQTRRRQNARRCKEQTNEESVMCV